jgi:hypothetical protein
MAGLGLSARSKGPPGCRCSERLDERASSHCHPQAQERHPIGTGEYFGRAENGIKTIATAHGPTPMSITERTAAAA